MHGEQPQALLKLIYIIGRTTKRSSEEWNTMALGDQTSEGLWSYQGWTDQNPCISILWSKGRPYYTSGWVQGGLRFSATSERLTHHICIQNINNSRDRILQHWVEASQCSTWFRKTTSLCVWQQDQGTDWPQATNTLMEVVNCSS